MNPSESRLALLQRITELVENPSLVHLIDHYLLKLEELQDNKAEDW